MLPKDKKIILKLRRRISFLILIILLMFYWVRTKYINQDFIESELEYKEYQIDEKDSVILVLKSKLDSVKKPIYKKTQNIKPKVTKKDTPQKVDTLKVIEDTTKN
jgi:hypothetical protein